MDFLNSLLQIQAIAAFLIFVVVYLVLMLSVVICFVISTCVYKGGCLARAYTVRSASLDHSAISHVTGDTDWASRIGTVRRNWLNAVRQPHGIVTKDAFHQRPVVRR